MSGKGPAIPQPSTEGIPSAAAGNWYAAKCPCNHATCKNWVLYPAAALQGVSFTKAQAKAAADALNAIESGTDPLRVLALIVANDAVAASYQSLGQYRAMLHDKINEAPPAPPSGEASQ